MNGVKDFSFTNNLRGIATLLVLFSHWGVNFFFINEVCAELGYFNPVQWSRVPIVSKIGYMLQCHIGLNPGMMGVALFFLISGFWVKSSLNNRTWSRFIITRIIRIYPLYVSCLFITCIILLCSAQLNNIPFKVNLFSFITNASLTRLWFWTGGIDGVVWTLEIEMFFYIIVSIIGYYGRAIFELKIITAIDCVSFTFIYVIHGFYNDLANNYMYLYKTLFTLGHYCVFIPFILLGIICRLLCDEKITRIHFYVLAFVQMIVFVINIYYFYPNQFKEYIISYSSMALFFGLSMSIKCKGKVCDLIRIFLGGIAKISFPFYALHGAAGYAVLAFLWYRFNNLYLSYIVSLILFVLLSYIVHISIERCTRKMQRVIDG